MLSHLTLARTARLEAIAEDVAEAEDELRALQAERRRVALELLAEGISERQVARLAGVSGPRVHQWKEQG